MSYHPGGLFRPHVWFMVTLTWCKMWYETKLRTQIKLEPHSWHFYTCRYKGIQQRAKWYNNAYMQLRHVWVNMCMLSSYCMQFQCKNLCKVITFMLVTWSSHHIKSNCKEQTICFIQFYASLLMSLSTGNAISRHHARFSMTSSFAQRN